jgi:hypothetical protein
MVSSWISCPNLKPTKPKGPSQNRSKKLSAATQEDNESTQDTHYLLNVKQILLRILLCVGGDFNSLDLPLYYVPHFNLELAHFPLAGLLNPA